MERSRAGGKRGWVRADGGIQLMYMCVSEVCTWLMAYSSKHLYISKPSRKQF